MQVFFIFCFLFGAEAMPIDPSSETVLLGLKQLQQWVKPSMRPSRELGDICRLPTVRRVVAERIIAAVRKGELDIGSPRGGGGRPYYTHSMSPAAFAADLQFESNLSASAGILTGCGPRSFGFHHVGRCLQGHRTANRHEHFGGQLFPRRSLCSPS
jgi:hypothetical protein